jgi:hypothetical protein
LEPTGTALVAPVLAGEVVDVTDDGGENKDNQENGSVNSDVPDVCKQRLLKDVD